MLLSSVQFDHPSIKRQVPIYMHVGKNIGRGMIVLLPSVNTLRFKSQKYSYFQFLQGYRLTFFRQEQAGPLKQNDCEPSPKLRGPVFGGILKKKFNTSFLIMSSKSVFF